MNKPRIQYREWHADYLAHLVSQESRRADVEGREYSFDRIRASFIADTGIDLNTKGPAHTKAGDKGPGSHWQRILELTLDRVYATIKRALAVRDAKLSDLEIRLNVLERKLHG
jgi:hypothetical protein